MSARMGEEQALALALEGREPARDDVVSLIALTGVLASMPEPEIDEGFAAALEARLMTEGLQEQHAPRRLTLVSSIPPTPADEIVRRADIVRMPRRRMVVRRGIAAAVAAASLAAYPLAAAASSLPGSPFYGIKKAVEQVQITFAGNVVQDGLAYARLAQRRADEIAQLVALDEDANLIAATASEVGVDLRKANDLVLGNTVDPAILRALAVIAGATGNGMAALDLPMGARAAVDDAIAATREIEAAVARALGGATIAAQAPEPAVEMSATGISLGSDGVGVGVLGEARTSSRASIVSPKAPPVVEEPTGDDGTGKAVSDPVPGCAIPGSADGLGDLGAPLAPLFCE
ncbi:MAG: DUF5667 domain-containing protein [Actinomycetota bacterium]